ncbi:MAG: hypothetical protein ACE5H0_03205 [Bacteroidota bacterium]
MTASKGVLLGLVIFAGVTKYSLASSADSKKEEAILKAYRLLEEAVRTGNGKLWLDLHTREILEQMDTPMKEMMQQGFPGRPVIRLQDSSLIVQESNAAVFGKFINEDGSSQFHAVRFVLEQGKWKILEEQISNGSIDPHSFLPPEDGSFLRRGSPWAKIPYAEKKDEHLVDDATNAWDMQAALDESFLYIRLSSKTELPAVGKEVTEQGITGAPSLPHIVVAIPSESEQFEIFIGDVTTTKFGETPRHFVNYSMTFNHRNDMIFSCHATSPSRLLQVNGKLIDVKIPRASLDLWEGVSLQLISRGPMSGFLPYGPEQF